MASKAKAKQFSFSVTSARAFNLLKFALNPEEEEEEILVL